MRHLGPAGLLGLIIAGGAPPAAQAESAVATGPLNPLTVSARLDFNLTIPRILYLRVGTGTSFSTDGTIDLIDFSVPAASVGNGTAIAAAGGDLGAGAVTLRVMGNGGDISLNSTTTGALSNATGQTIGWNQISVASSPLPTGTTNFVNGAIAHPAFNTGGGNGTPVTLTAANRLVRQEGRWTYSYANSNVVAAGIYGGVNVNNGRVSYTATMP